MLASAGVDTSNTAVGTVVLLPVDPDASARALRSQLRDTLGVDVAVVVSDTFGRPWRMGLVDQAVGVAGLEPLHDLRGRTDAHGNVLDQTVTAVADEIASAADLAKGKLAGRPVAVVRGLADRVTSGHGPGAAALVRPLRGGHVPAGVARRGAGPPYGPRLHRRGRRPRRRTTCRGRCR